MTGKAFEKPKKKGTSKQTQQPQGNNNMHPSPWLDPNNPPTPDSTASFVEYLRWMRSYDRPNKDGTKVQILDRAQYGNYTNRLGELNNRTTLIAGKDNTFQVKSTWRIRVGGHRGPESILLPAFDALGIPYIPSSSLRGVARNQAIREIMAENNISWENAEKQLAPYFGYLDSKNAADHAGKVVFLDAYPLANQSNNIVAMDMANNIWQWDNNTLEYSPNPNPFLSLKEPTFLIGLRLASNCRDEQILAKVKKWLITGLQAGIGSQVNSGYGNLITAGKNQSLPHFLEVEFGLEGQLIHGCQRFTEWTNRHGGQWQMKGKLEAEVRPTVFKSMLRYWFRAFTLGFLNPNLIKEWEAKLFGAINPQTRGWVQFDIIEFSNDSVNEQSGTLRLSYSSEAPTEEQSRKHQASVMKNLTWMMFNLGGIGQGARRPYYQRSGHPRDRGSTFDIHTENDFWEWPETVEEFKPLFRKRLQEFYQAIGKLINTTININSPLSVGTVTPSQWTEAVDRNCKIVVCSGNNDNRKLFALDVLHSQPLKKNDDYDIDLCGSVKGIVKPSPIWIADLGNYQLVTVFGANQNPRRQYLERLRNLADKYALIWAPSQQ